jgi:hypothetical protein
MGHQQDAIRSRLSPMVTEKLESTRRTQRVGPAKPQQAAGSQLHFVSVRQWTRCRDQSPIHVRLRLRLQDVSLSPAQDRGVQSRQIPLDWDVRPTMRHCLADDHVICQTNQVTTDPIDP